MERSPAPTDFVDQTLRLDPSGAYADMDEQSQRDYHGRINAWSTISHRGPHETAQIVVALATEASRRHGSTDRRAHVGYYLTDNGTAELAAALHVRLDWREKLRLLPSSGMLLAYCTLIFSICGAYGIVSVAAFQFDLSSAGLVFLAFVTALYASYIVQTWVNLFLPRLLRPRRMPRLDFSQGIPEAFKTLVVIPCLLTSREGIQKLARTIEKLYLDNRQAGVGYALLSDFVDAPAEHMPEDEARLREAFAQIAALNERHGGGFVILHRARRWNPSEGRWIGWERKRGKLEELNAFLLGKAQPFRDIFGDSAQFTGTKFVVTLDDDNADLPPGAIQELAGAIAHPLNRAVLAEDGSRVIAGYGVLQPRPIITLPKDAAPSRLELLVHKLIEIETTEAFRSDQPIIDIDHDLLGQVSYGGKGIYEVQVFHRLTEGLIAENTVLSHDVLEGGLVRAGHLSDLILPEPLLSTFYANAQRTHRWLRGDWQLLPWLLPRVRAASGARVKNPLGLFGRWKIFFNILRMLLPPASLLCFVIGWMTSSTPGYWTLNLLAIAWLPALVELTIGVIKKLRTGAFVATCRAVWAWLSLRSAGFIFAVHDSQIALDAAFRASFRMLITRRKMLEWTASSVASTQQGPTLKEYLKLMWPSPAVALLVAWLVDRFNPAALPSALPFVVLWFAAPLIAWWWSQTPPHRIYSSQAMQP